MMVKALDILAKCASAYKRVRTAWSNIYVRMTVFAILVAIIAYFFGWVMKLIQYQIDSLTFNNIFNLFIISYGCVIL